MNNDKNKEINKEQRNKKKNWFKHKLFAPYLLCFLLLFISIFCCSCTNKGEIENVGLKPNLQSSKNISDKGQWVVAKDEMINPRSSATANLLPDGNVLIMGGSNKGASDFAEIFDPKQMKIIKRIPLDDYRTFGYSAVSLENGDVYISGGYIYKQNTQTKLANTAKIFDSKSYRFREVKPMKYAYSFQFNKAFLLKNGNVFLPISSKAVIYNPSMNEYYEAKNEAHKDDIGNKLMQLENGDVIFTCTGRLIKKEYKGLGDLCLYKYIDNKFEPYKYLPIYYLFVQLDNENYLVMIPELTSSSGYIYNIKKEEKVPVNNKINRTWTIGQFPITVLLKNGNVLIIGISVVNNSQKYRHSLENRRTKKYSAYIYDRKTNEFYETSAPPIPFDSPGIVTLENGNILFAGGRSDKFGNKIQVFMYN